MNQNNPTRIIGSIQEIDQVIKNYEEIAIFHHIRPDGDCLGSQAGLAELLKLNYPNKKIYIIGNAYDAYPWMEWKFNDISEIKDPKKALAITVDVSQRERIELGEYFTSDYFHAIARIDHHEVNHDEKFIASYIDPDAAAAGEQIALIAKTLNWKINAKAVKYLYLSITTDSNRYAYSGNRFETLELGAWLLRQDFNVKELYDNLAKKTLKSSRLSGYILENAITLDKIIYFELNQETLKKYDITSDIAIRFTNTVANIDDYEVWFSLVQNEDLKTWKLEMRSKNVATHEIAKHFKGGGHKNASGATLDDIENQKPELIKLLQDEIKKQG
ncbi:bifunctional oligoribonuclease/PAP phosphatase NrnA [Mycoplasmopsis agassizii]|uniref:DHH family phosphoesterase n=1 Tax=Mycoplasmopsis agassizii TaxID=33922 RepID=UPI003528FF65